jgi:hypothetical protein
MTTSPDGRARSELGDDEDPHARERPELTVVREERVGPRPRRRRQMNGVGRLEPMLGADRGGELRDLVVDGDELEVGSEGQRPAVGVGQGGVVA